MGHPSSAAGLQWTALPGGSARIVASEPWAAARVIVHPRRFRFTSTVHQIDRAHRVRQGDRQLQLDLRRFDVSIAPVRTVEVVFSAKLLSGDGRVLGTRPFGAKAPAEGSDDVAAVKALNTAFGTAMGELGASVAQPMPARAPAL